MFSEIFLKGLQFGGDGPLKRVSGYFLKYLDPNYHQAKFGAFIQKCSIKSLIPLTNIKALGQIVSEEKIF